MGRTKLFHSFLKLSLAAITIIMPILAQAGTTDDLMGSMNGLIKDSPVYTTLMPGSMAAILCDFRRMFSGTLGQVIIATAVFTMGLMTVTGKMRPLYAIFMVVIAVVFVHPEYISKAVIFGMLSGNLGDLFVDICQPL